MGYPTKRERHESVVGCVVETALVVAVAVAFFMFCWLIGTAILL